MTETNGHSIGIMQYSDETSVYTSVYENIDSKKDNREINILCDQLDSVEMMDDRSKETPLHLSVLTDQPEVTRILIIADAEVDKRDKVGNTALHIACRQGQHKNVQNLLEPVRYHEIKQNSYDIPYQTIPQDVSIKNYEGLTCLHLAASQGHLDIFSMLLDKDIDVNLKEGKTGRTILHSACLTGDLNLVKLLLRHRSCNINARAYDGRTPFDLARIRGHEDTCLILAAAGAGYGEDFDFD